MNRLVMTITIVLLAACEAPESESKSTQSKKEVESDDDDDSGDIDEPSPTDDDEGSDDTDDSDDTYQTPRVYVDSGHHNYHILEKTYATFGEALREDGFLVYSIDKTFEEGSLDDVDILVIANAQNEDDVSDWAIPNFSAFTDEEITYVTQWVSNGGSLFLIIDHMPFPAGAQKLAAAFGFELFDGMLVDDEKFGCPRLIFNLEDGTLQDNIITRGLTEADNVDHVASFCGSAFNIPEKALPVLTVKDHMLMSFPDDAWDQDENSPSIDASEMSQGAVLEHSDGRVAMFGEAQIFTCKTEDGGMCHEIADQNRQFLLNVARWLDFQDMTEETTHRTTQMPENLDTLLHPNRTPLKRAPRLPLSAKLHNRQNHLN